VLDERGIAIFSKTPFMHTSTHYYFKPSEELREQDRTSEETKRTSVRHGVLTVELEGGLRIATVHHTWTQHGDKPSDYQKADTVALVEHLKTQPPCVITGDFNIPRGYNSFLKIACQKNMPQVCISRSTKFVLILP
jgi:endonuclease/exonuclease/phosphatase family metal-dependent hydrolase